MSQARQQARNNDSYFDLKSDNSALLIIDMQNGFLEPGALLEVPAGRAIIPNLVELLQYCRLQSVPVIWIQLDSRRPYGGVLLDKYPELEQKQVLFRGTGSFELFHEIPVPQDNEYNIVKHKYDSFHGTNLDILLRNLGVENVIITGVTSNCCCESTARSAFEHDYGVVFASYATAAFEEMLHENTLASIRELFGSVMTVSEILEKLKN